MKIGSLQKGGLDFGSFEALNHALIQKWRWWFVNEKDSLWEKVILAFYDYPISDFYSNYTVTTSWVWVGIIGSINTMHDRYIIPYWCVKKIIGNGRCTLFG